MADTYSPAVQAWLMGLGPSPFETPGTYQTPIMPPSDPADYGTLDYQNSALTTLGKANNNFADPALIAQLNGTAGGASADQFEQFATYEPVKAPGYMMMQNYLNSGDPISKFIASVISGDYTGTPGTANQAETELRKIYGDPAHPMYGVIQPGILTYTDQGVEQPDWQRIRSIATGLETAVINDPQFNALDPKTNMPAQVSYNETEIAKFYRENGIPNPSETYSPDLLATPEILQGERATRGRNQGASAQKQAAIDAVLQARRPVGSNGNMPYGKIVGGKYVQPEVQMPSWHDAESLRRNTASNGSQGGGGEDNASDVSKAWREITGNTGPVAGGVVGSVGDAVGAVVNSPAELGNHIVNLFRSQDQQRDANRLGMPEIDAQGWWDAAFQERQTPIGWDAGLDTNIVDRNQLAAGQGQAQRSVTSQQGVNRSGNRIAAAPKRRAAANDKRANSPEAKAAEEAFLRVFLKSQETRRSAAQMQDARLQRERMMSYLTKMGYTPANDVIRSRQAAVYGA